MKAHELLDAVGNIDPKHIDQSDETGKVNDYLFRKRAVIAAACLLLAAAISVSLLFASKTLSPNGNSISAPVSVKETTAASSQPDSAESLSPDELSKDSINIPAAEIPDSQVNEASDMVGLVVYQGGVYLQSEDYYNEDADRIAPILGDYLGYAAGTLDERSTQEEYSKELASTYTGEVFSVKGYDPGFRICVRCEFEREYQRSETCIIFLERLNGITVSTGKDVFEDRLHLSGNISAVEYQAHDDWDYGLGNIRECEIDSPVWERFIQGINNTEFTEIYWTDGSSFYEDHPGSSIYDTPNQVHLILHMDDGTIVRMRLIEGGYVRYEAFGFYCFVKIPGEIFDSIYDACGGTHITNW